MGKSARFPARDLVPGDVMILEEGVKIPADGVIITASDLSVNESTLTGEAEGVWKTTEPDGNKERYWRKDYCYAGTLVTQGSAYVLVEKTGASTEYGKIGRDVASAPEGRTPLQRQTGNLVKLCAGIAAVLFALVGAVTFFQYPGSHHQRPRHRKHTFGHHDRHGDDSRGIPRHPYGIPLDGCVAAGQKEVAGAQAACRGDAGRSVRAVRRQDRKRSR